MAVSSCCRTQCINTDPLINSTYYLGRNSPAIDSAGCGEYSGTAPLILYNRIAPLIDIDGEARPGFGTIFGCDMGADEYTDHLICFPVQTPDGKIVQICM